jgi:ElaB/YqjD/DUF883 family membrane-anchored ribosome-binding protein
MEKAKGGVVWVAKEFKARQELCFDLHFDLLSHADRSRLASSSAFVYGYAFMSSRPSSRRLDGGPGHTLNQSSLSFVVQRGSILEKQTMAEMQRKTQDITLDTYELTNRIADIREDLQKLTSMVGRLANSQLSRAQDAAVRTVDDFEEAIRRNPLSALGIAFGLGFLVAIFMRR